jgi:hypothetical protein
MYKNTKHADYQAECSEYFVKHSAVAPQKCLCLCSPARRRSKLDSHCGTHSSQHDRNSARHDNLIW